MLESTEANAADECHAAGIHMISMQSSPSTHQSNYHIGDGKFAEPSLKIDHNRCIEACRFTVRLENSITAY